MRWIGPLILLAERNLIHVSRKPALSATRVCTHFASNRSRPGDPHVVIRGRAQPSPAGTLFPLRSSTCGRLNGHGQTKSRWPGSTDAVGSRIFGLLLEVGWVASRSASRGGALGREGRRRRRGSTAQTIKSAITILGKLRDLGARRSRVLGSAQPVARSPDIPATQSPRARRGGVPID